LLLAIALLVLRADRREQRGALLAGALAAAGFLLSLLLIVASDNVITRNLVVVLIALILLFAGGLGASRAGLLGLAGVATLCAIGVIATSAVAVDGNLQRPAWRDLAHVLRTDHPPVAASAILEENAYLGFAGNYIPGLYTMRTGTSVGELDVVAADNVPSVALCWWGAACSLPRARLNTSIQIPGFRPAGPVVRVQEFAVYRLRATTPVVLTPAQIARAASNARLTSYGVLVQPPA
jgi:hypothetical protein